MNEISQWLVATISDSTLQNACLYLLRSVPGFPPIIQTVHILGIAIIMGTVVMLNLRVLGLAVPGQCIAEMRARLLPWFWWALPINALSGAVFVLALPQRYFNNPLFISKMALLAAAVALTFFSHSWVSSRPEHRGTPTAKLLALLSLVLWLMVPLAGRWIAYLEFIEPLYR